MEQTKPVKPDESEEDIKRTHCLCGFAHVRTGAIVIGLLEFVVIAHAMMFVTTNLARGSDHYKEDNPTLSVVILYKYMVPTLVLASIWMVSIVIMLLGVKALIPYLTIPHFIMQIASIVFTLTMATLFLINVRRYSTINWTLAVLIAIFFVMSLCEIYFAIVSLRCFRFLIRLRVQVRQQQALQNQYNKPMKTTKQNPTPAPHLQTSESNSSGVEEITPDPQVPVNLPAIDGIPAHLLGTVPALPRLPTAPEGESFNEDRTASPSLAPPSPMVLPPSRPPSAALPTVAEVVQHQPVSPTNSNASTVSYQPRRKMTMQSVDFDELVEFNQQVFAREHQLLQKSLTLDADTASGYNPGRRHSVASLMTNALRRSSTVGHIPSHRKASEQPRGISAPPKSLLLRSSYASTGEPTPAVTVEQPTQSSSARSSSSLPGRSAVAQAQASRNVVAQDPQGSTKGSAGSRTGSAQVLSVQGLTDQYTGIADIPSPEVGDDQLMQASFSAELVPVQPHIDQPELSASAKRLSIIEERHDEDETNSQNSGGAAKKSSKSGQVVARL